MKVIAKKVNYDGDREMRWAIKFNMFSNHNGFKVNKKKVFEKQKDVNC